MAYNDEKLMSLPVVNGWKMTADRGHRKRSEGQRIFVAQCVDCGHKGAFDSVPMFLKNSRKCRECNRYTPEVKALRSHESTYRYNAKKFNRVWEITFSEFVDIVNNICYYCGEQPFQRIHGKSWPFAGMDRIDSSKGYSVDNIRPCCRVCNVAKNDMSEEDFINKVIAWNERLIR